METFEAECMCVCVQLAACGEVKDDGVLCNDSRAVNVMCARHF